MGEVEDFLKRNVPSIFTFLREEKISWNRIEKAFSKEYEKRLGKFNIIGPFDVEASFLDVIVSVNKKEKSAQIIMDFFNNVLLMLDEMLGSSERKLMKSTLRDLLLHNNKDYLNFLGELATLLFIKSQDPQNLKLKGKEVPIKNGKAIKKIDFSLHDKKENSLKLIEVANIHIHNLSFETPEDLRGLLETRAGNKISNKVGHSPPPNFKLYQVLWFSDALKFKQIVFWLTNNRLNIPFTYEPLAFLPIIDNNSNLVKPYFGPIMGADFFYKNHIAGL